MLFADRAVTVPAAGGRDALLETLGSLGPGVTEITLHPAVDSPELRAATGDWASRVADLDLLVGDPVVADGHRRRRRPPHRLPTAARRHAPPRPAVTTATGPGAPGPVGPAPKAVTVTGLLLLDPHGYDPTHIDSVVVDDTGIGVVRRRGETPRILPWESVVAPRRRAVGRRGDPGVVGRPGAQPPERSPRRPG